MQSIAIQGFAMIRRVRHKLVGKPDKTRTCKCAPLKATNRNIMYVVTVLNESLIEGNPAQRIRVASRARCFTSQVVVRRRTGRMLCDDDLNLRSAAQGNACQDTLCYSQSVEMLKYSICLLIHYLIFSDVPVPYRFMSYIQQGPIFYVTDLRLLCYSCRYFLKILLHHVIPSLSLALDKKSKCVGCNNLH